MGKREKQLATHDELVVLRHGFKIEVENSDYSHYGIFSIHAAIGS